MNKIVIAVLLSFIAVSAAATPKSAGTTGNVGINFSVDSVIGIHGEFNISSMANNAPVSVQAFWKNYSQRIAPAVTWGTTGIGVAAIYDFNSIAKLDKKIHPYAGLGLIPYPTDGKEQDPHGHIPGWAAGCTSQAGSDMRSPLKLQLI